MKYLVMECHDGYAVLMDEASGFVRAANLHYTVGQTVTDPIIMKDETDRSGITRKIILRTAAAAACLTLISAAGLSYYNKNLKTQSVVTIGSGTMIEIELNSYGEVIRCNSGTEAGKEILKKYDGKHKSSSEAANDLIQLQIEQGLIADGDTVNFYIDTEDKNTYSEYKEKLEKELSDLALNVKIKNMDELAAEKPKPSAPPEPPQPPVHEDKPDVPPPPAPHEKEEVSAPAAPPVPPADAHKPDEVPDAGKVNPPEPPAPPQDGVPEPPKPDEPPAEGPAAHEPPAAPEPADGVTPPEPVPPKHAPKSTPEAPKAPENIDFHDEPEHKVCMIAPESKVTPAHGELPEAPQGEGEELPE